MSNPTFTAEYGIAMVDRADRWVPACGGFETPYQFHGVWWLYVYNHATEAHGWLNYSTDIVQETDPVADHIEDLAKRGL